MKLARLLAPASAALLAAALVACSGGDSDTPARSNLVVQMSSMSPHVGQLLELRVVHVESGVEVGWVTVNPVTTANFAVVIPDVLIAGETYYVDFYADMNMNGRYDDPPVDHAWRRVITNATPIDFVHDINWTNIDFPTHP